MSLLASARRASLVAASAASAAPTRRSLSSAAAADALVRPQLQLYGLHARYANALFSAASKAGSLARVEKDLRQVQSWIETNGRFREFLKNPVVKRDEKKATLAKISKGMEPVTREFLAVLAEKSRLGETVKVLSTFAKIMDAERGVVKCTVTSVEKLDENQLRAVKSEVSAAFLQKGQTLDVKVQEDPAILGGLQVQVGDKFIDLSVASKINDLHKALSVPASQ